MGIFLRQSETERHSATEQLRLQTAPWWFYLGLWLLTASAYVLTSCGRIDMIDAQYKFDVTASIAETGEIRTRDPILSPPSSVSLYPLGSSLVGLPLASIGMAIAPQSVELAQFLWTLTNALVSALIPVTLCWAWLRQGLSIPVALWWSLVAGFATLLWPTATSSFDQAQHAWFLLLAVLAADHAAKARSTNWAIASGALFSIVLHYQTAYAVLLLPLVVVMFACSTDSTLRAKMRWARCICIGALPGILAISYFNLYRFGSPLALGPPSSSPVFGNPLIGAAVVLVSPGKGILFFCPIAVIALLGMKELWRHERQLALLIGAIVASHLLLISSLAFPGGDWCWGPRYLVATLPLVCLVMPYGAARMARKLWLPVVGISLTVQILGVSLDHHRFYYERNLTPHFWADDPFYHFGASQLTARPAEWLDPTEPLAFTSFSPNPYGLVTYAPMGPAKKDAATSDQWMRQFAVFYWPRPWPLWMARLPEAKRFFDPSALEGVLATCFLAGSAMVFWGIAKRQDGSTDARTRCGRA